MADITKCRGDGCPMKEKCYRYTAEEDKYQSYLVVSPHTVVKNKFYCELFWGERSEQVYNQLKDIMK